MRTTLLFAAPIALVMACGAAASAHDFNPWGAFDRQDGKDAAVSAKADRHAPAMAGAAWTQVGSSSAFDRRDGRDYAASAKADRRGDEAQAAVEVRTGETVETSTAWRATHARDGKTLDVAAKADHAPRNRI